MSALVESLLSMGMTEGYKADSMSVNAFMDSIAGAFDVRYLNVHGYASFCVIDGKDVLTYSYCASKDVWYCKY